MYVSNGPTVLSQTTCVIMTTRRLVAMVPMIDSAPPPPTPYQLIYPEPDLMWLKLIFLTQLGQCVCQ